MQGQKAISHSYAGGYGGWLGGPEHLAGAGVVRERPLKSPAPDAGSSAASRVLKVWSRLTRMRAAVLVQQCRLVAHMRDTKFFNKQGYRNLGDFAREVLKVSPRTARRRLTVAKALAAESRVEPALLSGRLSPCQAEILAPVLGQDFNFWLQAADAHSIRELRDMVRSTSPPDHRSDRAACLHILAPAPAAAAFEHVLHAARNVLGWDAPRAECFEAILAEAESSLSLAKCKSASKTEDGGVGAAPRVAGRGDPIADPGGDPMPQPGRPREAGGTEGQSVTPEVASADADRSTALHQGLHDLLDVLDNELNDLQDLLHGDCADPVLQFRLLEQSLRPLGLLQGNLLLAARSWLAPAQFHQPTWDAVAECTLHMSSRRFRDLIRDAKFLYRKDMESVFVAGEVTLSHLRLIARLEVYDSQLDAWIARAKQVTFRQFAREIDVAEKQAHLRESRGPGFAEPSAVHAAPTAEALTAEAEAPGLGDPATDPRVFEALEREVHARFLKDFPAGVGRQTVAEFGTATTINLVVSVDVLEQWQRLRLAVQATMREPAPSWVCLVQLLRLVLHEWERVEPQPNTLALRMVERDGYHCTAPGCSQRRRLEAHHIVFRSRGGSDDPQNLTTLCAFHHRYGVHGGVTHLTGAARHNLHWRFPREAFHGQLRLASSSFAKPA